MRSVCKQAVRWDSPTPSPMRPQRYECLKTATLRLPTPSDLPKANLTAPEPPPRGGRDSCRTPRAPSVRARSALHPGVGMGDTAQGVCCINGPAPAGVPGRSGLKRVHWTLFSPRKGAGPPLTPQRGRDTCRTPSAPSVRARSPLHPGGVTRRDAETGLALMPAPITKCFKTLNASRHKKLNHLIYMTNVEN